MLIVRSTELVEKTADKKLNLYVYTDEYRVYISTRNFFGEMYGVPLRTKIKTIIFQSKWTLFAVEIEYFKFEVEYFEFEVEYIKIEVEYIKIEVEFIKIEVGNV